MMEDVRAEILRCRGTWFDPKITDVMLGMIDENSEYRMNENADGGDVWKEYDRLWGDMSVPYDANGAGFGYELPEKDRRIIDEVGKMLIELDWDGILSLVKTADT